MKKIFLIATLCVAGLVSAKSTIEVSQRGVEVEQVSKKKKFGPTIHLTTSCGNEFEVSFPSSWGMDRIIAWIEGFDAGNCAMN